MKSVFFDIDGTLDDSNDAHAQSWVDAFAEGGLSVPFDRIRPLIGMGADKLMDSLALGFAADSEQAASAKNRRKAIFLSRYLPQLVAFPGARELVLFVKSAGLTCVVASSASPQELEPLLEIAGVAGLFDHAVSPDEVAASKPDPDVVAAALAWSRTSSADAVMIGDTKYDIEAAHRAGVKCIALRCGGSAPADLEAADAMFDTPLALVTALQQQPFEKLFERHVAITPANSG